MRHPALFSWLLLVASLAAAQQDTASANSALAAMQQQMREMQERIIALEGEVRLLKQQQNSPLAPVQSAEAAASTAPVQPATPAASQGAGQAAGAPPVAGPAAQGPTLGGAVSLAKALNPDISMIGDFLGSIGGNSPPPGASQSPVRSLEMHESELGIQAVIDPYARGDFFLTFGEEGVGLEEGYITFTALPAKLVGRAGKMRAAFGKVNTLHNHVLPWVDRPLVTDNLAGGEEGISDAGLSLTRTFAGPKNLFLEATGQLFRGDSGDPLHPLFVSSRKSDVSAVAHFRGYKDITDSTNIDLGFSFARGHNDGVGRGLSQLPQDFMARNFLTYLYGADATLRWKPLRRSIYHSFVARGEFVWSRRQQLDATTGANLPPLARVTVPSFGYYASADYQFARRWFIGGRYDQSDRARTSGTDHGTSLVLTYWPSEFSQLRGQYRSTRYAEGISANELLFQVQFVLGAHGAHPF
jgi:hypothetical protein